MEARRLTNESFIRFAENELVIRVKEQELCNPRGIRIDSWLYMLGAVAIGPGPASRPYLLEVYFPWCDQRKDTLMPTWRSQINQPLQVDLYPASPQELLHEAINRVLLRWEHAYPPEWLADEQVVATRGFGTASSERVSPSDFFLLQNFVRLHAKLVFESQSPNTTPQLLHGAASRLEGFLRQQNRRWIQTVGLRWQP